MVMHLKTCCCGCSLKTGSVIIAVLTGIAALIGLIVAILGSSVGTGEFQRELVRQLEAQDDQKYKDAAREIEENVGSNKTMAAVFICMAIVDAIYLILSVLLVFGASAERPRLVKPWIVFAIMGLTVQSILMFINIIIHFVNGLVMAGVLGIVGLALGITLGVYFILVVNSFHTELLSNNFQNKI